MKHVEEYRNPEAVQKLTRKMSEIVTRPWTIMEVCGGQTHAILRYGLNEMLPEGVQLLHGPGCPVCVTPGVIIDQAVTLSQTPGVCLTTFGDMVRVPGDSGKDLLSAKAEGGDVRIVYSPMDAVTLAETNPDLSVVFFAVGFETTAPANAMAVWQANQLGLKNFYLLSAHVLVPPALVSIMESPNCRVQAFLAAGHVCTVSGFADYLPLAEKYKVPIVVTGFEPVDILQGLCLCLAQLEAGQFRVENQYRRSVQPAGNRAAQDLVSKVFEVVDQNWRGLGVLPQSGLKLRAEFAKYDAILCLLHFKSRASLPSPPRSSLCQSAKVLQGACRPYECQAFGKECTPEHPLGATMVSSEGACAAYYRYGRQKEGARP